MEEALADGVKPSKIGYASFTNKAVDEAKERACEKFGLRAEDLPGFRTLHSLCFKQLGLSRSNVFEGEPKRDFADRMNLTLTEDLTDEYGRTKDDKLFSLVQRSRVSETSLLALAVEYDEDYRTLDYIRRGLEKYKEIHNLRDFPDMIEQALKGDLPHYDLFIVDEAQDITPLMWKLVHRIADQSTATVVAGDDDQAIYGWNGADPKHFIELEGDRTVLDQSHRLPKLVHEVATTISSRIAQRAYKIWSPREERGDVTWINQFDELNLAHGSWLILARNGYLLGQFIADLERDGIYYERQGRRSISPALVRDIVTWSSSTPDDEHLKLALKRTNSGKRVGPWYEAFDKLNPTTREYVRACLRNGEELTEAPRVTLSTIHGAKGGEADNVLVVTDVSKKVFNQIDSPDEHRVFYVAVSRARQNLYLQTPRTRKFYPI